MISHPDFIDGLQPLVEARQAQGLTVKVVDVSSSTPSSATASSTRSRSRTTSPPRLAPRHPGRPPGGRRHLRLPGHPPAGLASASFRPSTRRPTTWSSFAPADPLLADLDGDGVQDLAIGRFPVRTDGRAGRRWSPRPWPTRSQATPAPPCSPPTTWTRASPSSAISDDLIGQPRAAPGRWTGPTSTSSARDGAQSRCWRALNRGRRWSTSSATPAPRCGPSTASSAPPTRRR